MGRWRGGKPSRRGIQASGGSVVVILSPRWGLDSRLDLTHGLRRGLYFFAAPRLSAPHESGYDPIEHHRLRRRGPGMGPLLLDCRL